MTTEVESLRAEVAALRGELAQQRVGHSPPLTRRRLLAGGLTALGVAGATSVTNAPAAGANDGDSLILGGENTSSADTTLTHSPQNSEDVAFAVITTSHGLRVITQGSEEEPITIEAITDEGVAFIGTNESSTYPAISGENGGSAPGLAATSRGHGPQLALWLEPDAPVGPPSSYSFPGAIRFDANRDLWLCTSMGPPAAWTRLLREDTASGRTVPIAPIRAIDTRAPGGQPSGSSAISGQKAGPLTGGASLTLDLAGIGSIPASATGVIGNLTAIAPNFSGYLTARPSGTTATTSSLNFPAGVAAIANAFTSQLGPDGLTIAGSGTSSNTYHLVVDLNAYIT